MRIRDFILPEDKLFLTYFSDICIRITQATELLEDQIAKIPNNNRNCHKIKTLEHETDDILRKIFERMEESLITPLEPEEIARLSKALDDVMDTIDWVSHQICNYGLSTTNRYLQIFAEYISLSVREINLGISLLENKEQYRDIKHSCVEINQIWNQSSDLLASAVSDLFTTQDMMLILKLKDIYENLEEVLQECNDVGHVLNEIVMRHS